MPLIEKSTYKPPFLFGNGHVQSIVPTLFRKVRGVAYTRERINTPDNDFIDLDCSGLNADRAVIIIHGLEGNASRAYMLGMARAFNRRGWDSVSINLRGCSGEPNRLIRSYHSGISDDLDTVVCHLVEKDKYASLALVGFSIGGNIILKYLGEKGPEGSPLIKAAAAVSVPCDLASSARKLADLSNMIYMKRFLKLFHEKIKAKMALMPEKINDRNFKSIRTFQQFDDRYTAPIHGFADADDYWSACSSKQFLSAISIPTLMISAWNDPFLPEECYPREEAGRSDVLYLEIPDSGGHVGFIHFNSRGEYWHETRITSFVCEHSGVSRKRGQVCS